VQVAPACVTLTAWPAMSIVAVRALADALAATVTVTDPPPLPVAGENETQVALEDVDHAQPEGPLMVRVAAPPPAAMLRDAGDTVKAQVMPACVTATGWPATVRVVLRATVVLFSRNVTVTEPLPLPDAGETAAHIWLDDAVHEQPAGAVTATVDVPAPAPGDNEVGETV
jgi:hypothetical protein